MYICFSFHIYTYTYMLCIFIYTYIYIYVYILICFYSRLKSHSYARPSWPCNALTRHERRRIWACAIFRAPNVALERRPMMGAETLTVAWVRRGWCGCSWVGIGWAGMIKYRTKKRKSSGSSI